MIVRTGAGDDIVPGRGHQNMCKGGLPGKAGVRMNPGVFGAQPKLYAGFGTEIDKGQAYYKGIDRKDWSRIYIQCKLSQLHSLHSFAVPEICPIRTDWFA